jgi:hypothetical protein
MIDTHDATIREALHDKERTESEAEYSRKDYLEARRTSAPSDFATAAMIYAEAANKAHLAAERYEELVIEDALSTRDATVLGVAAVASRVE